MTTYENQGGLLVKPGTNECAGYIFHFDGRGGYDPTGKVKVGDQEVTRAEVDAHNKILADAELKHAADTGRALFYLTGTAKDGWKVTNFAGQFAVKPWHVKEWHANYWGAWGNRPNAATAYFTGPDGKKWYGIQKGDNQILRARRLKKQ